jgi:hypothetical protein
LARSGDGPRLYESRDALFITREWTRVAAYLAEERRRDPHSVVNVRPLPSGTFHGALRAETARQLVRTRRLASGAHQSQAVGPGVAAPPSLAHFQNTAPNGWPVANNPA